MLKVNIGVSRKLSKDFNSTGFSLNVEGELAASINDPEQVIERIREYYDVAEAALQDQIDRHGSIEAIADRDADESGQGGPTNGRSAPTSGRPRERHNGQPSDRQPTEQASNKQVQYVLNLAKRQGLSTEDLESRIAAVLGRPIGLFELSKRQAGQVIDNLTENGAGQAKPSRRS
jgi:hypothetical protein